MVLQQMDQRNLASLAVSCSKFRQATPAHIKTLVVRSSSAKALESFSRWQKRQHGDLSSLTRCRVAGAGRSFPAYQALGALQAPQLLQLALQQVSLQADTLQACSGLTALLLRECVLPRRDWLETVADTAPSLQHLAIQASYNKYKGLSFSVQNLTQLTHLSIDWRPPQQQQQQQQGLHAARRLLHGPPSEHKFSIQKKLSRHLSTLVNLQHLRLTDLAYEGLPGGFPPQLSKLTCLDVQYTDCVHTEDFLAQFQHLSSLTALQHLRIAPVDGPGGFAASRLSGIQHLSQLTSLELSGSEIHFGTLAEGHGNIISWAQLPALQRLSLTEVEVLPEALAAFTRLRSLQLRSVITVVSMLEKRPLEKLFRAVSQLTQLTQLSIKDPEEYCDDEDEGNEPPRPAAFAALTASTNLRSLDQQDSNRTRCQGM
jgi:hypothetical protein